MVFYRLLNDEDDPLPVSLSDALRGFKAGEPSVGNELGAGGFDAGGIAPEHESYPGSRAAAFVGLVSLGQHRANKECEHYAGVYRLGSLGCHENHEHAAGHTHAAVYVVVSDMGNHVFRELT